jgi:hypothetical protein
VSVAKGMKRSVLDARFLHSPDDGLTNQGGIEMGAGRLAEYQLAVLVI